MDDYYALLQVSEDAEAEVIRFAFKALAKKYHPDQAGPDQEERMRRINEAYAVLSDPDKRAAYDRARGPGFKAPPPAPTVETVSRPETDPPIRPPSASSSGRAEPKPPASPVARAMIPALFAVLLLYFGVIHLMAGDRVARARGHLQQGGAEQALELLNEAIRSDPHNGEAFLLRARALHQLGQNAEALVDLSNAAQLQVKAEVLKLLKAEILIEEKRPEEALRELSGLEGAKAEALRARVQEQLEGEKETTL